MIIERTATDETPQNEPKKHHTCTTQININMEMEQEPLKQTAHGQTDPHKPGNRPKAEVEATIKGLAIGRNKIVVPKQQVYELAAIGCTDADIARFYGVNINSLRYNFKTQLIKGREDLKITLRRAMLKTAISGGNVVMQIFLAKNLLSMSDTGLVNAEEPLPWTDGESVEDPALEQEPDCEPAVDDLDTAESQ